MEEYIQISKLNDFVFCPYSLYLKSIYENFDEGTHYADVQINGKLYHKNIDSKRYSSSKNVLVGAEVYSDKYKLAGKIDIYFKDKKELVERKFFIKDGKIYSGQKYQLYAQYFCLKEEGYEIKKLSFYSLKDNKKYKIDIPDKKEEEKFKIFINKIHNFSIERNLNISKEKCKRCIYNTLCFKYADKG